jgi:hypothetical protein
MKDSVTYQAILREGREEGREQGETEALRRVLLAQGERRFGPASVGAKRFLETLQAAQLDALTLRLLDVESWDELLTE